MPGPGREMQRRCGLLGRQRTGCAKRRKARETERARDQRGQPQHAQHRRERAGRRHEPAPAARAIQEDLTLEAGGRPDARGRRRANRTPIKSGQCPEGSASTRLQSHDTLVNRHLSPRTGTQKRASRGSPEPIFTQPSEPGQACYRDLCRVLTVEGSPRCTPLRFDGKSARGRMTTKARRRAGRPHSAAQER
jgi:hypothetical protein